LVKWKQVTNSKTIEQNKFSDEDHQHMRRAVELARIGLGQVWPNPTVGCVLVKNNKIIGEGRTADGGRPHGERLALDEAGEKAQGATAYVSLEPCAHTGKTPPCATALVEAGVAKVIYAIGDPDPRVAGRGHTLLAAAGVDVAAGLMAEEAVDVNQGFFTRITKNRPYITLKMATSLDGKIASAEGADLAKPDGQIEWITSAEARRAGHIIRSQNDAILVGINTVLADNPSLTYRLKGEEGHSPVRIVLDSSLKLPLDSQLVETAKDVPVWVLTQSRDKERQVKLKDKGCKILWVDDTRDVKDVLAVLADEGLTRLMVEGGAQIHSSFLKVGLIDEICWFRSPNTIGSDGLDGLNGLDFKEIKHSLGLISKNIQKLGKDTLETFIRKV
jgi:diaminohydroxyphosphoribosylaminopyrimidine deaminase/5-amino-6-(5-phosphoribosylamino)uracil reductase